MSSAKICRVLATNCYRREELTATFLHKQALEIKKGAKL